MPTDKLLHLLVGIAIAAILYPFGVLPAVLAVCIAAIGKELQDMRGHGTPEVLDAAATIAGGGLLLGWYSVQPVLI
jgi:nucleoside permease NupC